jgi:hypothetical protein
MRTLIIGVLVIALMVWGMVRIAFPPYEKDAEKRVATILNGMRDGKGSDAKIETAMNMWAYNAYRVGDRDRLSWASDNFDRWRQEKKMYRQIKDYEITKVEKVPGTEEDTAIVSVKIEGQEYKMRVPKDHAIHWE